MDRDFDKTVEAIFQKDSRYKEDAYAFVMEALAYTQKKFNREKHVTGEEILDGMKDLLLHQYGPLAMAVLDHWGIRSTEDFGHIVFNLVENNILNKTEEDNFETFRDRYDFEEVFREGYRHQLDKKINRMRVA